MWPHAERWFLRFLVVALSITLVVLYLRFVKSTGSTPSTGTVETAKEPKKVAGKVHRKEVPPPRFILVYDKPELAARLKMPELTKDPGDVLGVASVKPHKGETTVLAVLDNTGVTRMLERREPPPFFDVKKEFQVQTRYLFLGENRIEVDLSLNPLRIGPVDLEAGAGVEVRREDNNLGARGWIGATYRF